MTPQSSLEEEALTLLRRAESLRGDHRKVFSYFSKHFSVGDIRAVEDLEKMGVRDPQSVIQDLIEMGLLERGLDCYNLAKPLRVYLANKRRLF